MIAFLLFCILLCLCPPLRKLVGALFWIAVIGIWWHWPADVAPPLPAPAAIVEEPTPAPVLVPPPSPGPGIDYRPLRPSRPYIQQ